VLCVHARERELLCEGENVRVREREFWSESVMCFVFACTCVSVVVLVAGGPVVFVIVLCV